MQNNTTFQVRFNRSKFDCATLEEATEQALDLVEASKPFEAKIVELAEDGEFVRAVQTYGPANAR